MTLPIVTTIPLPAHLAHATAIRQPETAVYLRYDAHGLCLCQQGEKGVVQVDFAIAARITLHQGNATELMPALAAQTGQPDVVYLDPMYPERQKSAAVKKEMAYFHALLGQPENERNAFSANDAALFQAARAVAKKRIVVKRPRLGAFLCGEKPAYQYAGKSTRFDVYLPKAG